MTVTLKVGEHVMVEFADTDGKFMIQFSGTDIIVKEVAGLPGNIVGKANAVLYHESGMGADSSWQSDVSKGYDRVKALTKDKG